MTAVQICALIALILFVGLTYWAGYRGGLIDGRFGGIDEGMAIQQSDHSQAIRNLEHSFDQAAVKAARIDERAEFEKEFPIPEGLQYCRQRGTYIVLPGASTSDSFAREHYAYRAGFAAWMRRAWKQPVLGAPSGNHLTSETDAQMEPA
jgi:hypothetical protein